jgi:hypothetical protein
MVHTWPKTGQESRLTQVPDSPARHPSIRRPCKEALKKSSNWTSAIFGVTAGGFRSLLRPRAGRENDDGHQELRVCRWVGTLSKASSSNISGDCRQPWGEGYGGDGVCFDHLHGIPQPSSKSLLINGMTFYGRPQRFMLDHPIHSRMMGTMMDMESPRMMGTMIDRVVGGHFAEESSRTD